MLKNIGKSILFLFILVILIVITSYLLLPWRAVKKYGIFKTASYSILSEEENTIDAVAIGDSLIYSSISPMEIWHNYGYTTFDAASAGQHIKESYLNLEVAIENQHPKIVFFSADVLFRDSTFILWYANYRQTFEKYFPIVNYHDNWKKNLFNFMSKNNKFDKLNVNKGYVYISKTEKAPKNKYNYMIYTNKVRKIPEDNLKYFLKMVNLCQKNNIKLVLISIPDLKKWNYKKHNAVEQIALKYELEFIDLNIDNPLKIDWQKETKDSGGHLNYLGTKKVSNFIGEYLKNSKLFIDHRKDKRYQAWNNSYLIYQENLK